MTRILEALRKSSASHAQAQTAVPVRPLRPQAPGPAAAARSEATAGSVALERGPRPVENAPELSEEAVREMTALRMTVESSFSGRLPRVLMFMSAQSGEGTSTVAAQFAAATAGDSRQRVLLMDLHARRPSPFVEAPAPAPHPGIQPIGRLEGSSFDVLPVPDEARRQGVVAAPSARAWVEALANRYDWIVLDGPPLLEAPDAAALAAVAEGVVMVIEAGRTKRPIIHRATDLLRKARANTIGSVLNRRRLEVPEFLYRRI